MKGTFLGSRILLVVLVAIWALTAVAIVALSWHYAPEYEFFRVPIASWVVFVLLGGMLALVAVAILLWRGFRRAKQELGQVSGSLEQTRQELGRVSGSLEQTRRELLDYKRQPVEVKIPVVRGGEYLSRDEFVVLLQSLFRLPLDVQYIQVVKPPLAGSYGGSTTLLVRLTREGDAGFLPRPFVVKLGYRREMAGEFDKYTNYVMPFLTRAPSIFRYSEWQDLAAIAYEFAGLDLYGEIQNLAQFYGGHTAAEVSALVGEVYAHLDQAWYREGRDEVVDLYQEYDLLNRKKQQVVTGVGKIIDEDDPYHVNFVAAEEELRPKLKPRFCAALDIPWYDPVAFLRTWPKRSLKLSLHRSAVHGDLNARNVVVEIGRAGRNLWFIDFSHAGNGLSAERSREALSMGLPVEPGRGHTLRDFCRLEADVKFILTPLRNDNDLRLAVAFEKELWAHGPDLGNLPVAPSSDEVRLDERFQRAWQVVREIRGQAARYLVRKDEPRPYYLALLHATLPVVYYQSEQFEGSEGLQKRYALLAAGVLCDQL